MATLFTLKWHKLHVEQNLYKESRRTSGCYYVTYVQIDTLFCIVRIRYQKHSVLNYYDYAILVLSFQLNQLDPINCYNQVCFSPSRPNFNIRSLRHNVQRCIDLVNTRVSRWFLMLKIEWHTDRKTDSGYLGTKIAQL